MALTLLLTLVWVASFFWWIYTKSNPNLWFGYWIYWYTYAYLTFVGCAGLLNTQLPYKEVRHQIDDQLVDSCVWGLTAGFIFGIGLFGIIAAFITIQHLVVLALTTADALQNFAQELHRYLQHINQRPFS